MVGTSFLNKGGKMTYLISEITFYKLDEEGEEVLDKDGKLVEYTFKPGIRVKALENLTDDFDDDMMEEVK
tara:strand:+ start:481 stop:690 length:210 start_codon:yes stop_codon:yes gene_type:complete